jgi:hypothetical protein
LHAHTDQLSEYAGSFLDKNAVADDELHSHITDEGNWTRLWDLSEKLTQEEFTL